MYLLSYPKSGCKLDFISLERDKKRHLPTNL